MKEPIYRTEKISEHIYKITELGFDNNFLIVGSEKALLVDCGIGVGYIRKEIEKITSLPVLLVTTHAHADHIGGAREFGELYVHSSDLPITRYCNAINQRSYVIKKNKLSDRLVDGGENLPTYGKHLKIKTFNDGKIFSLGGVSVEAINTPGHTIGSCVFKIAEDNIVLLGDNFIPMLFLQYDFAASLSRWIKGCEKLFERAEGCELYGVTEEIRSPVRA